MSLRYKVGDRVELGGADVLATFSISKEYRHCIGIIVEVDEYDEREPYKTKFEDDQIWWTNDDCIDHEATAKLNNKSNDDSISSVISIDMSSYITRRIDCEGGETMNANEILNTWERRKRNKIELERNEKTEQITRNDEIKKLIEKHVAQINKTIKEKYNTALEARNICAVLTPETEEKLKVVNHESETQKLNIESKVKDIKAVLDVAENQDKVFEILNKQGIIDKNYNIL